MVTAVRSVSMILPTMRRFEDFDAPMRFTNSVSMTTTAHLCMKSALCAISLLSRAQDRHGRGDASFQIGFQSCLWREEERIKSSSSSRFYGYANLVSSPLQPPLAILARSGGLKLNEAEQP